MFVNIPDRIKQEIDNISEVNIEMYEPLFPPAEFKGKVARQLKKVRVRVPEQNYRTGNSYDVHDGTYNNFKSLRFIILYKDKTVNAIDFELKEDVNSKTENFKCIPVEETQISSEPEIAVIETSNVYTPTEELLPASAESSVKETLIITQQTATEVFFDELTEEENRLEKRLALLRSADVLAKRKAFVELSKKLEELRVALQPIFDGKL